MGNGGSGVAEVGTMWVLGGLERDNKFAMSFLELVFSTFTKYNNNNLPSIIPQVRSGEDRVYVDLTSIFSGREVFFEKHLGKKEK